MDPNILKILGSSGINQIYAAIDTNNMTEIVRAAMTAFHMKGTNGFNKLFNPSTTKSKSESSSYRLQGNKYYKAGKHRQAIEFYNKALAFAPKHSEEMILAYSNRSAVTFTIGYYRACVVDINICIDMGCSEDLKKKLVQRLNEATPKLGIEYFIQMMTNTEFVASFLKFEYNSHSDVPSASTDVAFSTLLGAKRATANREIKPGTLIGYERAFVSSPTENLYLCCYYCNRPDLCLHPCEGCTRAMFCDNICRDTCMHAYHCIECQVMSHLSSMYENQSIILATRAVIKLSLRMSWSDFISASKNIGLSRMKTATTRQMFNSEEAESILTYDDVKEIVEGKMFNGSIVCACVITCLSYVGGYYPKDPATRTAVIDAMARIMLHLFVTFDNKIAIVSSAYDFNRKCFQSSCQSAIGWFSMASKLKHSCVPNLYVMGLNDTIALIALRTIKKGEELTIAFNGHYYDGVIPKMIDNNQYSRASLVYLQTRQMCDCVACQNNWDLTTLKQIEMTKKQSRIFAKVSAKEKSMNFPCYYSMCESLDAFPVNTLQHKCGFDAIKSMFKCIQSRHSNNLTYLQ